MLSFAWYIRVLLGIFTPHFAIALKPFADVFVKFIKLMIISYLGFWYRGNE